MKLIVYILAGLYGYPSPSLALPLHTQSNYILIFSVVHLVNSRMEWTLTLIWVSGQVMVRSLESSWSMEHNVPVWRLLVPSVVILTKRCLYECMWIPLVPRGGAPPKKRTLDTLEGESDRTWDDKPELNGGG
jgi:hypothetical protein